MVACILSAKFLHVIPSSTLQPGSVHIWGQCFQENFSLSFSLRIDQKLLWCTLHFCCMHTSCFLLVFVLVLGQILSGETEFMIQAVFFSLFSFSVLKTATLLWFVVSCVGKCSDEKICYSPSVQFKMVSVCSEKPIYVLSCGS